MTCESFTLFSWCGFLFCCYCCFVVVFWVLFKGSDYVSGVLNNFSGFRVCVCVRARILLPHFIEAYVSQITSLLSEHQKDELLTTIITLNCFLRRVYT